MVLPAGCPPWEYDKHPLRPQVAVRIARILKELRQGARDSVSTAKDTRPAHGIVFQGLTPPGVDYYAGHYRGEPYRCLRTYDVKIDGDPRVGIGASGVESSMVALSHEI